MNSFATLKNMTLAALSASFIACVSTPAFAQSLLNEWHFSSSGNSASVKYRNNDGKDVFSMWCTELKSGIVHADYKLYGATFKNGATNVEVTSNGKSISFNGHTTDYPESQQVYFQPSISRIAFYASGAASVTTFNGTFPVQFADSNGVAIRDFVHECYGADQVARFEAELRGGTATAPAQPEPQTPQPTTPQPTTPQPTTPQPTTPQPQTPQPQGGGNNNGNGAAGLAGAILGIGTTILANEVLNAIENNNQPQQPAAPTPTGGQPTLRVSILTVRAIETTFGFGGDEIFLSFNNGVRMPAGNSSAQDIDSGQTWSPNQSVDTAGGLGISLFEYDSLSSSDLIGQFTIAANHGTGRYTQTLRGDGAEYEITYQVDSLRQAQVQPPQNQPQTPPPANTQNRRWGAHGLYDQITATDCTSDCEEDIGIVFMCQGFGQPALVSIPWAAVENGSEGATAPLRISVGNRAYDYTATLGPSGLVGHIPSFYMYPGDPALESIMAGNTMYVDFLGNRIAIGLRGSRSALSVFEAHCEFNNPQFTGQNTTPTQPTPQPQAPQPQNPGFEPDPSPFWFVNQYENFDTGAQTVGLTLGIPETDAGLFFASCEPQSGNSNVNVEMLLDFGSLPAGTRLNTFIAASSLRFEYPSEVFYQSDEWAGVKTTIDISDPIWVALQNARDQIQIGIVGGDQRQAPTLGAFNAIGQFKSICTPPTLGNQPTQPTQPTQPQPQPQPQPTQPAPQPTQPTGQNSQVIFVCDDNSTMSVALTSAGAATVANVVVSDGTQYALIQVPSEIGTKFSNGISSLTITGTAAQLATANNAKFCQAT